MDKLIQVLNQPPSKNDLDEAYLSRLIKDLKRIQEYTKQAEKAIESFDKIESVSIEKHIIALYDSYGSIPYTPEKNDTIATAATSVILEEMIQEKQKEIAQPCEESKKAEFDFTGNIDELKKQRATRLEQIKELSLAIDREFLSPLPSKWAESLELQRTLSSYLKKVLIKYLAISDRTSGSVNNKDQVRDIIRSSSNFFNSLLTTEWVCLPENLGIVVDTLVRDGVLIVKNQQAKLRGFDSRC